MFGLKKLKTKNAKTILVLDDDRYLRNAYRRFFEKRGFSVTTTDSYDTALQILGERKIDLCIFDIALEEKSGLELLKTMRSDDRYRDLPVIIQSGFGEKLQKEAIALHPHAVFQKPVKMEDLLWTIKDALGLST